MTLLADCSAPRRCPRSAPHCSSSSNRLVATSAPPRCRAATCCPSTCRSGRLPPCCRARPPAPWRGCASRWCCRCSSRMLARWRTGSERSPKPRCPRDHEGYGCRVAATPDDNGLFVVTSRIQVSVGHSDDLGAAFRDRSGVVDGAEGFDHLEVWRERRDATHFVMTSWWTSPDAFKAYMRSDGHRTSHARVSRGAGGPRGVGVARFDVVAR